MEIIFRANTNSLHGILTALSFYKTCPGCRIGFVPPTMEARVIADADVVQSVLQFLNDMVKELKANTLFRIRFTKREDWKYDHLSFLGNESSRCYAHEFKEKVVPPNKKDRRREYETSPFIILIKNDSFFWFSKRGSLTDKCRVAKLLNYCSQMDYAQVHQAITGVLVSEPESNSLGIWDNKIADWNLEPCSGCGRNIDCTLSVCPFCKYDLTGTTTNKFVNPRTVSHQSHTDKDFGWGWEPQLVSNNSNVQQTYTPFWPIKSLMALVALSLFETYLVGRQVVVDGCRGTKKFLVPLSEKPLTLEEFRLLHRHPKIWKRWEDEFFWKKQGLVDCKLFVQRKVGKCDVYYDLLRKNK